MGNTEFWSVELKLIMGIIIAILDLGMVFQN